MLPDLIATVLNSTAEEEGLVWQGSWRVWLTDVQHAGRHDVLAGQLVHHLFHKGGVRGGRPIKVILVYGAWKFSPGVHISVDRLVTRIALRG